MNMQVRAADSCGKGHKNPGKIKFISNGLGWKETITGVVITIKSEDILSMAWSRVSRDYQLQIVLKEASSGSSNTSSYSFDGFPKEAHDQIRDFIRQNYSGMYLDQKEYSLKGSNWGKLSFNDQKVTFSDTSLPSNESTILSLSISDISNVALTAKNEISIETALDPSSKRTDALVDIRFFVPGEADGEIGGEDEEGEFSPSPDSANGLVQSIKSALEATGSDVASSEIVASFRDLPFIVPRGRYEMDLYISALRLRGKSYDYKIPYANIVRLFLLPRPDDSHVLMVLALEPPIRQGQTRYPFLIVQFAKEMDTEVDIALGEQARIPLGLEASYEGPQYEVVSKLLKSISMKKLIVPGASFQSPQGFCAVKCTVKANEGHLYFLEKCFLFVPKPAIILQHDKISSVTFSRQIPQAHLELLMEEFGAFEKFLRDKGIRYQNDLPEQRKIAYKGGSDSGSDDDAVIPVRSDIEDGEDSSTDEDYQEGDSGAEYSSSASDDDSESNGNESAEDMDEE
ncbi:FACT complex component Pob3 [Mitosporidium daphniae]|uniref:FACT complex subunit POB3 n=1 Tax=Mitosporidium daphniae TaxID=1485682 RepID=A0A098VN45_9MICR|nr:FACT complex component Pob3 [Mitosporidium daphniae]KGG50463.1 FACT complex component Pob3 [Mitosporidium daphniae]|eukprot:XP_013236890.1 FACT complex component Pob3 [Mitosporidium daphniae]